MYRLKRESAQNLVTYQNSSDQNSNTHISKFFCNQLAEIKIANLNLTLIHNSKLANMNHAIMN